MGQLGRQGETPPRIAFLHFELSTFTSAAPEQLKPSSGAADTR
jgi:hypothetical protein